MHLRIKRSEAQDSLATETKYYPRIGGAQKFELAGVDRSLGRVLGRKSYPWWFALNWQQIELSLHNRLEARNTKKTQCFCTE